MGKFCVKCTTCCHGNRVFDAMFTQILFFKNIFLHYLTKYLKQGLSISLKINIFCNLINVARDL